MRRFAAALLFAVAPFATLACAGAEPDLDDDDAVSAEAELGQVDTFALYTNPGHVPSPGCDVRTKLELWTTSGRRYARLTEELAPNPGGPQCKIFVLPNKRTYRLGAAGDACGSTYWRGTRRVDGAPHVLELADHRTRRCRDLRPARVVVDETVPGEPEPVSTRKFSYDRDAAPAAREVTLDGTLRRTMALGGESTGTSVQVGDSLVEVRFGADEASLFVEDARALVTGVLVRIPGVAIPMRDVVDVTGVVTCPTTKVVSCMPGPKPASTYCAPGVRAWVEASCPGVGYTF